MGRFEDFTDSMKTDGNIPKNVHDRVLNVLDNLPDVYENVNDGENKRGKKLLRFGRLSSRAVAVSSICIMAGAITAAATTYMHWSRGLESSYRVEDSQKEYAENSGIASNPVAVADTDDVISDTENDITVSVEQTFVDDSNAALSFNISGYELPEGAAPYFESIKLKIDGQDAENWDACFYDGIVWGKDNKAFYDDGTPCKETADGALIERYEDEDGCMEYTINVHNYGQFDSYVGKQIEVSFDGLGYNDEKADDSANVVDGNWNLKWTLSGDEGTVHLDLNEDIGDTGITLLEAEYSPLSVSAIMKTDRIWDTKGEMPDDFPMLVGVKLKDGTLFTELYGGGTEGYIDIDKKLYGVKFGTAKIIDPDDVTALLFKKNVQLNREDITENDVYIVPVK